MLTPLQQFQVLNRYLPYNLEVEVHCARPETYSGGMSQGVVNTVERGRVQALGWHNMNMPNIAPHLTIETDVNGRADFGFAKPRPILRSFNHLAHFINHKGSEIVPAIEIAKIAIDRVGDDSYSYSIVGKLGTDFEYVRCKSHDEEIRVYIFQEFMDVSIVEVYADRTQTGMVYNMREIYEALYAMHFAVGLNSEDYIERSLP